MKKTYLVLIWERGVNIWAHSVVSPLSAQLLSRTPDTSVHVTSELGVTEVGGGGGEVGGGGVEVGGGGGEVGGGGSEVGLGLVFIGSVNGSVM